MPKVAPQLTGRGCSAALLVAADSHLLVAASFSAARLNVSGLGGGGRGDRGGGEGADGGLAQAVVDPGGGDRTGRRHPAGDGLAPRGGLDFHVVRAGGGLGQLRCLGGGLGGRRGEEAGVHGLHRGRRRGVADGLWKEKQSGHRIRGDGTVVCIYPGGTQVAQVWF